MNSPEALRTTQLPEACRGELVRLENGRRREDIACFFIQEVQKDSRLIAHTSCVWGWYRDSNVLA